MASPVPQKDDVERWTVEQVAAWLRQLELTECCEYFLRRGIDGRFLMELTEEGLLLWGRDLSIRNRRKILKLIKQIETQHLVATGRLPPSQIAPLTRQLSITHPKLQSTFDHEKDGDGNREDLEFDNIDEDDFSSDEFDDVVEQEPVNFQHEDVHSGNIANSTDSGSSEDLYLEPLPHRGNRNYPNVPPRPLPSKPPGFGGNPPYNRQPYIPPDKRPPMPLPHNNVNQGLASQNSSQRPGGQIGGPKLPPGHGDLPKRGQSPLQSSAEYPRRPAPTPGSSLQQSSGATNTLRQIGSKPNAFGSSNVKQQMREWPPKKSIEPPSSQNSSQSESSVEGGGGGTLGRMGLPVQHRSGSLSNTNTLEGTSSNKKPSFLIELQQKKNTISPAFTPENTDNEYEVVENPGGAFSGGETHSGSPPGLPSPNQAPPPLPQRNQDGSRSGPNQQHSSVGSNAPHSRLPVPPPGLPSRAKPSNLTRPAAPIPGSVNNSQNKTGPHSSVPNIQDWPQKASSGGLAASQSKPQKLAAGSGSPVLPRTPLQHHPQFNVMPPQVSSPPLERAPSRPPSVTPLQNSGERIPIGDGESIFLTPLYRTLYDRPFFHVISRSKSKLLLENAADGVYLIRPSTRSSDPLTLCLQYSGRTYHINIRKRGDGLYALGKEKVNEMTFNSVDDLVSTYTNEPIKLQSGDRVQLRSSPAKSDHIYVKLPSNFQKRY